MIKEFAFEPEAITTSYRDFCYFTEKFGVSQGRVISEFPSKWKRKVCDSALATHKGSVECSRIIERLKMLGKEVVFNSGRKCLDGNIAWIDQALNEHANRPFSAIIASSNPTANTEVLVASELDDSVVRFKATDQKHITRTAVEIVDCVELLLGSAKIVKLIDPHFDPSKKRWRRMLELVLSALSSNGQADVTLEIHRADNALPGNIKNYFNSSIPGIRPAGITVHVFLHPETSMHNRFILTHLGGASYHTGLDDNEDGNSTPTDLVSLLASDILAKEWDTYSSPTAFLVYP